VFVVLELELIRGYYLYRILQTLRAGPLIKELNTNIRNYIEGKNQRRKVFIYSTHDTKIALIMHAFGLWNGYLVPPGASLLLELQQVSLPLKKKQKPTTEYFVRLFYFNETYTTDWAYQLLSNRICATTNNRTQWRCPVQRYLANAAHFEPYDWQYQCGLKMLTVNYFAVNLHILATNFVCLLMLFVLLRLYSSKIRQAKSTTSSSSCTSATCAQVKKK